VRGSAPAIRRRPTPDQELLLEAGTAPTGAAGAAWEAWKRRNSLDGVDPAAQRLLPLVYRHLQDELADDADLGRLKGLYRRSWYRNQIVLRWTGQALESLRAARLDTLTLKGAALSALYYRDSGARPMEDVDILVRTEQAEAALDALAAAGWTPVTDAPRRVFLAVRHAEELARGDGARIDLHWNALWQPGRDDAFWDASVDLELHGQRTRALCPSDELLHACVHGAAWNAVPPIRWVADALTVLAQAGDAIDWERLVAQARAREVTYTLAEALGYLAERFEAAVPAGAVEELARTQARLHERVGHRAARAAPSPVRTLCVVWDRYRRLETLDTPFPPPRSFVAYARETWGFDATGRLAAHGSRRLAAHVLRRLGRRLAAVRRATVRSSHP
jgi:Uncharacterised nucleotidyltransferase